MIRMLYLIYVHVTWVLIGGKERKVKKMGNANGREGMANDQTVGRSNGETGIHDNYAPNDSMSNSPPHSPSRSQSPLLFAPQVPVAPLQRADGTPFPNHVWQNESHDEVDQPSEEGIAVVITWNYDGNNVAVEGSWDNWTSRKLLQRSGKDHTVLMVLPSGIYHYKFIVDGKWRYIPDLPYVADEVGGVCNLLNVHNYVPENLDSVAEFEGPPSPGCTYTQAIPSEEDFAKEPLLLPPQLNLSVVGVEEKSEEVSSCLSSSKPQHVMLNHVFIEKGWASQSVVALGLTHRYESKYVTVVLYKPLKR